MDVIVLIFVIIWIVSKFQKGGQKRPGQQNAPQTAQAQKAKTVQKQLSAKPVKTVPKPVKPQKVPEAKPAMQPEMLEPEDMTPQKLEPTQLEMELYEGESMADEDGCIGGSIAHGEHAHEGLELHSEADFHGIRSAHAETEEQPAEAKPSISAQQLRNAVIWAEILDRPVSMRE